MIVGKTPVWMFRAIVDITSRAMGHSVGALHSLPEKIRAQTALDYTRTAPGVYNIPNTLADMTPHLNSISVPTLVVWGDRDPTLTPASFPKLVSSMPHARGKTIHAGHVPHQSHAEEFNRMVVDFLRGLSA
jgi:pimeloyl-ACP methyl ester carboxylesterase